MGATLSRSNPTLSANKITRQVQQIIGIAIVSDPPLPHFSSPTSVSASPALFRSQDRSDCQIS
jgi:hypothetical protein